MQQLCSYPEKVFFWSATGEGCRAEAALRAFRLERIERVCHALIQICERKKFHYVDTQPLKMGKVLLRQRLLK